MVIRVRSQGKRVTLCTTNAHPVPRGPDRRMTALVSRLNDLLVRLVPRLTFDEPLECEFRGWYAEHTRSRVLNAMWIAIGNMLVVMLAGGPFREMRSAIFGPENALIVDVLRFGFIVPSSLA